MASGVIGSAQRLAGSASESLTGRDSKFDLHLLSQCCRSYTCLSRSFSETYQCIAKTVNMQGSNNNNNNKRKKEKKKRKREQKKKHTTTNKQTNKQTNKNSSLGRWFNFSGLGELIFDQKLVVWVSQHTPVFSATSSHTVFSRQQLLQD